MGSNVPLLAKTFIRCLKIFQDQSFYQRVFSVNLVQTILVK